MALFCSKVYGLGQQQAWSAGRNFLSLEMDSGFGICREGVNKSSWGLGASKI